MSGRRPAVTLLWGEDSFLLREAALEILGDIQAREIEAGEWQDGETANLATPSLFGERRALLVNDCRSLSKQATGELAAYLTAPAEDAVLILSAEVPPRGKAPAALVKLVEPVGRARQVALARRDLQGWVTARAAKRGVEIAPDGARALVDVLGEDPAALDQAVTQLSSAFPGTLLIRDLVVQQFRGLGEQHIWDLCDRAFGRDLPGAIRSLRSVLAARSEGLMIVGGIASRLRDLLRVKGLPDRMPLGDLAKAAGLRFDWQARRYRDQARRYTLEELVRLHARVTDADRALKSGAADDVVLPVLVAAIAGEAAASWT